MMAMTATGARRLAQLRKHVQPSPADSSSQYHTILLPEPAAMAVAAEVVAWSRGLVDSGELPCAHTLVRTLLPLPHLPNEPSAPAPDS